MCENSLKDCLKGKSQKVMLLDFDYSIKTSFELFLRTLRDLVKWGSPWISLVRKCL